MLVCGGDSDFCVGYSRRSHDVGDTVHPVGDVDITNDEAATACAESGIDGRFERDTANLAHQNVGELRGYLAFKALTFHFLDLVAMLEHVASRHEKLLADVHLKLRQVVAQEVNVKHVRLLLHTL